MNRKIIIFLLLGVLLGIGAGKWYAFRNEKPLKKGMTKQGIIKPEPRIPSYVLEILRYVETFNEPKKGYSGGDVYTNELNLLPDLTPEGKKIEYRKWNLHSKKNALNESFLITGSDHSAWYNDHACKKINRIK